jgi:hypothetical protein
LPISLFISIGYGIFMSSVLTVFIATNLCIMQRKSYTCRNRTLNCG